MPPRSALRATVATTAVIAAFGVLLAVVAVLPLAAMALVHGGAHSLALGLGAGAVVLGSAACGAAALSLGPRA